MRSRFGVALLCAGLVACRGGSDPAGSVSVDPSVVRLGYPQSVAVKFRWRPARALDRIHGSPVVFVHLIDRVGQTTRVLRTYDHALPGPWTAGQAQDEEIDIYQSALADPLPPGKYVLSLGLYDDSWGYRWPLEIGPEVARREYAAASVDVSEPDESTPRLSFTGGWMPAEAVQTRQVLAHRCLAGPATLSVEEIRAPGVLRLQWSISGGLALSTTCEPGRNENLGPGRPWVSIGFRPTAGSASGRCEILALPTSAASTALGGPAAACLEVLAFRPGATQAGSGP